MAYSDKVIEHYENPRNVGTFKNEEDVSRDEVAPGSSARPRAATSCGSRSGSRTA
jgi:nitrogen fixation NifU-like protein